MGFVKGSDAQPLETRKEAEEKPAAALPPPFPPRGRPPLPLSSSSSSTKKTRRIGKKRVKWMLLRRRQVTSGKDRRVHLTCIKIRLSFKNSYIGIVRSHTNLFKL